MQDADKEPCKSQTKGMGQRLCQCESFIAPLESLVRVAELPKSKGRVGQTTYPDITAPTIAESEWPMALTIVERDSHFEVLPGGKELPHPARGISDGIARVQR